jgi:lysophospholipase L1-like esterase
MGVTATHPPLAWKGRLLLSALSVVTAAVLMEAGLRAAHFQFDLVPALQFGWPDPVTLRDRYVPDRDLVWVTRDYGDKLWAARHDRPAIVFMGDSCTEFGTYPAKTLAALKAADSPLAGGVALGVGGWSSEQGLTQLRRDVIPLHPKVITIYFGWNDHWLAMGLTDPQITRAHQLRTLAEHLRLAQLLLRAEVALAARQSPPPNRVPSPAFSSNVLRLAREAQAKGITPVFITAPSNHVQGHEPAYLAKRHVRSLSEVVPLHTEYMNAVREAAAETGAPVCDAAAAFTSLPAPHDRYFQKDGIHLTDAGDVEMSRALTTCLLKLH